MGVLFTKHLTLLLESRYQFNSFFLLVQLGEQWIIDIELKISIDISNFHCIYMRCVLALAQHASCHLQFPHILLKLNLIVTDVKSSVTDL